MISDAAKAVCVENHVLRYWEEELHLPIQRNESGHRIYSEEDVECFKQIKDMKDKGLQLKAIHMLIKNGNLKSKETSKGETGLLKQVERLQEKETPSTHGNFEDKLERIQWLFNELVKKALQETLPETMEQVLTANLEQYKKSMCTEMRESLVKELDYQFRMQTEREDEREKAFLDRSEFYYEQIDELLRRKKEKKKRRFLFKG